MSDQSIWSSIADAFWPTWSNLFHFRASGLAPAFVLGIWLITALFLRSLLRRRQAAHRSLRDLAAIIDGVAAEDVAHRLGDMAARAQERGGRVRELWHEYDAALVATRDRTTLHSVLPAADVFAPERVAPELVGNRILTAVPAFLTAVGLIGTLIGLAAGLKGLQLANDPSLPEISAGVQNLVTAAALGFTASVWGVLCSVLTNYLERRVERAVIDGTRRFQADVDGLFAQTSAEQALVHIEASAEESTAALNTLHEKIGSQFQEALGGMTSELAAAMTAAIEAAIAPTMRQVAEHTTQQSSDALERLLAGFTEQFKRFGEDQARELGAASERLDGAVQTMTDQVGALADEVGALTSQIEHQTALLNGSLEGLAQEMTATATLLGGSTAALDDASARLGATADVFGSTGESLETALENAAHTIDEINAHSERAADALRESTERFGEIASTTTGLGESLRDAASQATAGFEGLGEKNDEFLSALGRQVQEYASAVRASTVERLDEWNEQTREFSTEMLNATKALSAAVDEVEAKSGAVAFAAELRQAAGTLAAAVGSLDDRQQAQREAADEMRRLAGELRTAGAALRPAGTTSAIERREVKLEEEPVEEAAVA